MSAIMQSEPMVIQRRANPIVAIWHRPLVQSFLTDPITLVSGAFITLIVLVAILAPIVAPHNPEEQQVRLRHLAPFSKGTAIDRTVRPPVEEERFYILGTDHLGRDMVSRLVFGGRISISVGVFGVLVSGALGMFLGLVAGYYRGVVDDVIMRAVDVFMSVPLLLLALMVMVINLMVDLIYIWLDPRISYR